jgi:hypothetical protein
VIFYVGKISAAASGQVNKRTLMSTFENFDGKHELKNCPRCGKGFECRSGDISNCQCFGIKISEDLSAFIAKKYSDCLCIGCLQHLNQKQNLFIEKFGPGIYR